MNTIFHRTELADSLAERLLNPGALDVALRSGLFLRGMRRTGKSTFLRHDFIPALEARGAVVVYVDLWQDPSRSPATLVHQAIRDTVDELARPESRLLKKLRAVTDLDASAFGVGFGLSLEKIGEPEGPTLAQALTRLVDRAEGDVVLIIDEVQHALGTEPGRDLLFALKAARDAVNLRPDTPGLLLFVGTGSHRALVGELTEQRSQAFAGARTMDFPLLGQDYVGDLLSRLKGLRLSDGRVMPLPSPDVALEAFATVGHRPEDLLQAFDLLRNRLDTNSETLDDPDIHLPTIAATLRASAVDVELAKLDRMGALASALFARLVVDEQDDGRGARGFFGEDSLQSLSESLGRAVSSDDVTAALRAMTSENLVMRLGHGRYGIADPVVRELSRERHERLESLRQSTSLDG
ncbi:MAG: ATP-binding protein [Granulosicoccus sp.]|nr:ATP-binding protein [Granulosicoccus sp.]